MIKYPKLQFLVISLLVLVLANNILIQSHASIKFTDIIRTSGIQFKHENGKSYKKYFTETLGSGVALFDYDNDNDLDIYFVNGSSLDNSKTARAHNHLYQNNGNLTFTDVTTESQTGNQGCGTGVVSAITITMAGWTYTLQTLDRTSYTAITKTVLSLMLQKLRMLIVRNGAQDAASPMWMAMGILISTLQIM